MPSFSDYLQAVSGSYIAPVTSRWVRLVNNATATAYVSTGATDSAGLWSMNNVPPGSYTMYSGPSSSGAWTGTGDANYQVGASNLALYNVLDFGAVGDNSTDDSAAFQAAVTAAIGSGGASGRVVVPFTNSGYKLNSTVSLPSTGTNGLVIEGVGIATPYLNMATAAPFLTVGGSGYHYDLGIRGLRIANSTNTLNFTTSGQVVRLALEKLQFYVCTNPVNFNTAGGVVGFAIRDCLFSTCAGDNIKCNPSYQASPGLIDTCWFQSSSATLNSYINAPYVGGSAGDNWTIRRAVFEGPHATASSVPIIMGGVKLWTFEGAQFADFADVSTNLPLIKTLTGSNAAPNSITFLNCDLENFNGPAINLLTGATASGWSFISTYINTKAGTPPINSASGATLRRSTFIACSINPAITWPIASHGIYLGGVEAGTDVGFRLQGTSLSRAVNQQTLAANGAVTIDSSVANTHRVTLQANATSSSITATIGGPYNGQDLSIEWLQDASGSRTYAWPATCKFAAGAAPTATTTGNYRDIVNFRHDIGSGHWIETSRSIGVPP